MLKTFLISVFVFVWASSAYALDLKAAESLALRRANEIRQYEAESASLEASAIASNQLPDPMLMLGALNFPVDTFKLSQEPMTQIQAGISQVFPKGSTLKYQYLSLHEKSKAARAQRNLQQLLILRQVRSLWYELYLWQKSEEILLSQQRTFRHLKEVAGSLFANNKVPQKDVLNAQLELSQIKERLIKVRQSIDTTRASLARWIGEKAAIKASTLRKDKLNQLARFDWLKKNLVNHPFLKIDKANIAEAKAKIEIACQDYKPGFSAGIAYGYRQGRNLNGTNRPDFFTGTLSVSMPLFPKNRQDKRLLSATKKMSSLKEKFQLDYKEMKKQLDINLIDYKKINQRVQLYRSTLVSEARQYADSTLLAYQNNRSDFINVAQSHIRWLNIELAEVQETVAFKKTYINLLYLQGMNYEK
jgi:outer membrane protein TolC